MAGRPGFARLVPAQQGKNKREVQCIIFFSPGAILDGGGEERGGAGGAAPSEGDFGVIVLKFNLKT